MFTSERQLTNADMTDVLSVTSLLAETKKKEIPPVPDLAKVRSLTKRELQVMILLAVRWSNREIAEELEISVKTIDTHRGKIMKKLGVRRNDDLVAIAVKFGFIDSDNHVRTPAWLDETEQTRAPEAL